MAQWFHLRWCGGANVTLGPRLWDIRLYPLRGSVPEKITRAVCARRVRMCPSSEIFAIKLPHFANFSLSTHSSTRGYICPSEQKRQKSVCPSEQRRLGHRSIIPSVTNVFVRVPARRVLFRQILSAACHVKPKATAFMSGSDGLFG